MTDKGACFSVLTAKHSHKNWKKKTGSPATKAWCWKCCTSPHPGSTATCHPSLCAGACKPGLSSHGKYLTARGDAGEQAPSEEMTRGSKTQVLISQRIPPRREQLSASCGRRRGLGARRCREPPPLVDWRDLRTLIRDTHPVMSPCYPSIHLLHMIKGPVTIIIVQLTGLTMKLNLLYFISVSKWTF